MLSSLGCNSMPLLFPDENTQKRVIEANDVTNNKIKHWARQLKKQQTLRSCFYSIMFFFAALIFDILTKSYPQFKFTLSFIATALLTTSICFLILLLYRSFYLFVLPILFPSFEPTAIYKVLNGMYSGHKNVNRYLGTTKIKLIYVYYTGDDNKEYSGYSDISNSYLFDRHIKAAPLRIVRVYGFNEKYMDVICISSFFNNHIVSNSSNSGVENKNEQELGDNQENISIDAEDNSETGCDNTGHILELNTTILEDIL